MSELDVMDRALVAHLCRDYENADKATRVRLKRINSTSLDRLRHDRQRLERELSANQRAIALREACLAGYKESQA